MELAEDLVKEVTDAVKNMCSNAEEIVTIDVHSTENVTTAVKSEGKMTSEVKNMCSNAKEKLTVEVNSEENVTIAVKYGCSNAKEKVTVEANSEENVTTAVQNGCSNSKENVTGEVNSEENVTTAVQNGCSNSKENVKVEVNSEENVTTAVQNGCSISKENLKVEVNSEENAKVEVNSEENVTTAVKNECPNSSNLLNPTLIIAGGEIELKVNQICFKLNETSKQMERLCKVPFEMQLDHSVCEAPDGFVVTHSQGVCFRFIASRNKWYRLPTYRLHGDRTAHGLICVGDVLYAIGGRIEDYISKYVDFLKMLVPRNRDPRIMAWERGTDLPIAVVLPKVAALGPDIFLLDEATRALFQIDLMMTQRAWRPKAPVPHEYIWGSCMVAHNGRLYLAGTNLFAWYTPDTDDWVMGSDLNKPLRKHMYGAMVVYNDKLVLLGGKSYFYGTDDVEEYDTETGKWSLCEWKMPESLCCHQALVLDLP
jgi:hypothetical protein